MNRMKLVAIVSRLCWTGADGSWRTLELRFDSAIYEWPGGLLVQAATARG